MSDGKQSGRFVDVVTALRGTSEGLGQGRPWMALGFFSDLGCPKTGGSQFGNGFS
jgi:hypothetical protein